MKYPSTLPTAHQQLLSDIIRVLSADKRIDAIGASGSFASNNMDQYSDLDLVIAIASVAQCVNCLSVNTGRFNAPLN